MMREEKSRSLTQPAEEARPAVAVSQPPAAAVEPA
jgi:hypothetical protein